MNRRPITTATGFTTVELLIVIGILMVLAGMVYVGFRSVGGGGKSRSTRGTLETARAMMAEIEAAGGMSGIKDLYDPTKNSGLPAGTINGWDGYMPAPTVDLSMESYSTSNTVRYTAGPVRVTQQVMGRLMSSPVNRSAVTQLPADVLLKGPGLPLPTGGITFGSNNQPSPAMLVDAWNNPLLFVPRGGLRGVKVGDNTNQLVTSGGVVAIGSPLPAGASAFWASAGADGIFSTGDDNVYSFE